MILAHKLVSSEVLHAWGNKSEGKTFSNLDIVQGSLLPPGQLIPFRGLGKKPVVDLSVSSAPLIGLDHHFVSKIIYDPKSKHSLKKVPKPAKVKKKKRVRDYQLKQCLVRLESSLLQFNQIKKKKKVKKVKEADSNQKPVTKPKLGAPMQLFHPPDLFSRVKVKERPIRPKASTSKDKSTTPLKNPSSTDTFYPTDKSEQVNVKTHGRKKVPIKNPAVVASQFLEIFNQTESKHFETSLSNNQEVSTALSTTTTPPLEAKTISDVGRIPIPNVCSRQEEEDVLDLFPEDDDILK